MQLAVIISFFFLVRHLRFVRQESDVDLFQGFDLFSGERLAEFIEQLLRTHWLRASMNAFQSLVRALYVSIVQNRGKNDVQ